MAECISAVFCNAFVTLDLIKYTINLVFSERILQMTVAYTDNTPIMLQFLKENEDKSLWWCENIFSAEYAISDYKNNTINNENFKIMILISAILFVA